jgi:hypothetical protein
VWALGRWESCELEEVGTGHWAALGVAGPLDAGKARANAFHCGPGPAPMVAALCANNSVPAWTSVVCRGGVLPKELMHHWGQFWLGGVALVREARGNRQKGCANSRMLDGVLVPRLGQL